MPEVYSLPVSTSLLAEVNAVGAPNRNKAQDGTIGDRDHMSKVSDHNLDEIGNTGSSGDPDGIPEVHARDVDARGPWLIKGGAERIVQLIVANVRAMGYAKRRVKYVIFKRRIWEWVGGTFVQRAYTGSDPHDLHFHVSFMYGSGSGSSNPENNTSPWGIRAAYEQESDVTEAELRAAVKAELTAFFKVTAQPAEKGGKPESKIGHDASSQGVPDTISGGTTYLWALVGKIGALVKTISENLDIPVSDVLEAVAGVDEAVLASLADAGRSNEDVAASLRAALGDRAGAVGRLLAVE